MVSISLLKIIWSLSKLYFLQLLDYQLGLDTQLVPMVIYVSVFLILS